MSWKTYALDDLGEVSRGRSRHRPRNAEHLYGGPFPFVQTGDVKAAPLYLTEYTQTYSDAGLAQSKLWPAGTLCITIAANIAETCILGIDACFPDSIIGFVPDPSKTNTKFIKYQFDAVMREQMKRVSQGVAQDNLSQEKLLSFRFPVPDLPTQKRIAGILSAYDDLIENNRRRIGLLEQAARLLYREWFVHFRFPGHEITKFVDGLPEGWSHATIADLFDTSSGSTPSRKNEALFGGNINWLKTQELQNCYIFETDEKITEEGLKRSSAKIFPENTVIIAMYGATIGQLAILAKPSSTNQACCALLPKRELSDFMFGYCHMEYSTRALKDRGQGAAQNNVSQQVIRAMEMVLPNVHILDKFNTAVASSFIQRRNLQSQNAQLTRARDLLLPRLMDGRIPV